MQRHRFSLERGSIGQADINAKKVQSLESPLPPLSQLRQFAEIVQTACSIAPAAESGYEVALVLNASRIFRLQGTGS